MNSRRRNLHRKSLEEVGMQIAPMIDITLLLLFFFMLTNSEDSRRAAQTVHLPKSIPPHASSPEPGAKRCELTVDAQGAWFVNGRRLAPAELPGLLKNTDTLLIRADGKTPAATIQRIAAYAAEGGVRTLEHAIQKP
jgi:biopolymer transport protein ExbD